METDIKETVDKLREVEKKCIKSRYETYGNCQCQGCRYAMEQHKYLALLETWAKDHEKAKIISKEIGIDEVVLDMKELISNDVSRYLEHMYSFEAAVNHSPMFYRDIENIRHWNTIGAIDYNRPMTTPLCQGLRENNLNLIREGCEQIDINELDPYGKTPLMYACAHCSLEIVKALVGDGADVNKRDLLGWTPLFYCKDTAIADYLLSVGADINAQDYRGNNLLLHNILDPMGDSGFAFSPNTPLIELLINRGIDVNAKDNKGNTALMHLIGGIRIKDKKKILTLLRQAPTTDVNIKNAEGKTAIDIVKENINKTIEYARLRQAIEEQRGTIGGCVVGDEPEYYVPPRKEVKLPEIDEVELTPSDREDIEECQEIFSILQQYENIKYNNIKSIMCGEGHTMNKCIDLPRPIQDAYNEYFNTGVISSFQGYNGCAPVSYSGNVNAYTLNYFPVNFYKVWFPLFYLLKRKELAKDIKILELGAGPGTATFSTLCFYRELALENPKMNFIVDYTAIEKEKEFEPIFNIFKTKVLEDVPKNLIIKDINFVVGDAFEKYLEYGQNSFDLISESHLLNPFEKLSKDYKAKFNDCLNRLLKKNGNAILIEPGKWENISFLNCLINCDNNLCVAFPAGTYNVDISGIEWARRTRTEIKPHWFSCMILRKGDI